MLGPHDRLTLRDLDMEPASAFAWPITCRWTMLLPWGLTSQTLTVNVPSLAGDIEASRIFGRYLWSLTMAPAISRLVELLTAEVVCWSATPLSSLDLGNGAVGQKFSGVSRRDDTPQVVLLTGSLDAFGRRRLFLPGAPPDWSEGGLLTKDGWEGTLSHARALWMGLQPIAPNVVSEWLVAYPRAVLPSPENPSGLGLRRIRGVRVCHHTDRAPDLSGAMWP